MRAESVDYKGVVVNPAYRKALDYWMATITDVNEDGSTTRVPSALR